MNASSCVNRTDVVRLNSEAVLGPFIKHMEWTPDPAYNLEIICQKKNLKYIERERTLHVSKFG